MSAQIIGKKISEFVREASVQRLRSSIAGQIVEAQDEPFPFLMPGEWMTLILVSNQNFKVLFKVFFDLENIFSLMQKNGIIFNSTVVEASSLLKDFMREYCNLTGGFFKVFLERAEIQSGISLPLAIVGFDDFFLPAADLKNAFEYQWVLKVQNDKLYCSAFVEFMELEGLEKMANLQVTDMVFEDGNIDFL